jgi:cytidylate kinase
VRVAGGLERPEIETATPFAGVIALDGPSGTGKSTVARELAIRLSVRYLDTGAMYRAATLATLRAGVAPDDARAVIEVVDRVVIDIDTDPHRLGVRLDGEPVDAEIRSATVTGAVSAVSAVPAVRERMVAQQRALIGSGGIVVEGRDIGTVVWPEARPKVYLTADVDERARRRTAELSGATIGTVAQALAERDRFDSTRAASPLIRAADAVEIDTTYLSVYEVVNQLVDMAIAVMADSRP